MLAVGSELLYGETRDTNSGDIAGELTALGVEVVRLTQLPDDLVVVTEALQAGLARADLLVTGGGLGPTPDDLTRESIAAALGEEPFVDLELEAWLRDLWAKRGLPFSNANLKQAWLIPSATALPNPYGTAPGWWVESVAGSSWRCPARRASCGPCGRTMPSPACEPLGWGSTVRPRQCTSPASGNRWWWT